MPMNPNSAIGLLSTEYSAEDAKSNANVYEESVVAIAAVEAEKSSAGKSKGFLGEVWRIIKPSKSSHKLKQDETSQKDGSSSQTLHDHRSTHEPPVPSPALNRGGQVAHSVGWTSTESSQTVVCQLSESQSNSATGLEGLEPIAIQPEDLQELYMRSLSTIPKSTTMPAKLESEAAVASKFKSEPSLHPSSRYSSLLNLTKSVFSILDRKRVSHDLSSKSLDKDLNMTPPRPKPKLKIDTAPSKLVTPTARTRHPSLPRGYGVSPTIATGLTPPVSAPLSRGYGLTSSPIPESPSVSSPNSYLLSQRRASISDSASLSVFRSLPRTGPVSGLDHKRSVSVEANLSKMSSGRKSQRSSQHQIVETTQIHTKTNSPFTLLLDPWVGEQTSQGKVNQYHILKDIGSGAYGRVVLCWNEELRRFYACKIISKSRLKKKFRWQHGGKPMLSPPLSPQLGSGDGQDHMALIKREIAILKKVSKHPNINRLLEVLDDEKEDNLYLIFELCEYGPIMNVQPGKEAKPYSEEVARTYFRDILLGLEYLHFKRIIHRDLKPENLLRTADNTVQIADFGISHMFEDSVEDPVLSDKNASPLFSPPEASQVGTKVLKGKAVDVWSLGTTLYCLVHGRCPFDSDNIIDLQNQIANAELVTSPTISLELKDLLNGMMKKNPEERITLPEIRNHPWTTKNGTWSLITMEENCRDEDVTEEEVENAFKPATHFVSKILNIFKDLRKGRSKSPSNSPSITGLSSPSPALGSASGRSPSFEGLGKKRRAESRRQLASPTHISAEVLTEQDD